LEFSVKSPRGKYWVSYIEQKGALAFLWAVFRKVWSSAVKHRFRRCDALMLMGSYSIAGWRGITIGSLVAGPRLRLEAIQVFAGQRFNANLHIGANVSVGCDVHIGCVDSVTIGDNVLFGSCISVLDHDHGSYRIGDRVASLPSEPPAFRRLNHRPILIGDNVHVGDHVVILKGSRIGRGAVIGAGSVVSGDIPDNCIAVGNPASAVKRFDGEKGWVRL
jgi:lipopolysaccharide O-acetyltransferase